MALETGAFSGSEESSGRCKQLFPEGKNDVALTALLDAYEHRNQDSEILSNLQAELDTAREVLTQAKDKNADLQLETKALQEQYDELLEISDTYITQLREQKSVCVEVGKPLTDTQLLLDMPEAVKKMLVLTAERLSDKYKTPITPNDILIKIFVRYTVERFTNWFYNFVFCKVESLL